MKDLLEGDILNDDLIGLAMQTVIQAKNFWRALLRWMQGRRPKTKAGETSQLKEEEYRLLEENQAEGLMIADPDEVILYVNRAGAAIFGMDQKELTGRRLDAFTDAQNFAELQAETARRLRGEKSAYEVEITRSDGSKRTLLVNASPRFDENGEYTGALGAFFDISDRKNAEMALQQSQERYQELYLSATRHAQELALLERVRAALANELELHSLYRLIVEAVAETFGYTQVSIYLLHNDRLEVEHQVGYKNIVPTIPLDKGVSGRVVRTGQPALLEDVHADPDFIGAVEGVTSEVCVPVFDQDQVIGTFNVESVQGVRLTEADLQLMLTLSEHIRIAIGRARLYTQARGSETSYRTLANNLPGIVFRLHLRENRAAEFFNPMLEEITGYTPAEIRLGEFSPIASLILLEDRNKVNRAIKSAFDKNRPFEVEYRIRRKDGGLRYCVERGRPIAGPEGKPVHIDGVILDLTERRQAEERMTKYARQMEALYATSLAINSQTEPSALLKIIVEQAAQMLGVPRGGLYLILPGNDSMELVACHNLPKNYAGTVLRVGEGLPGKVAQSGEVMFVSDYAEWKGEKPIFNDLPIHRLLAIPLKVKRKVIGVIELADDKNSYPFSEEDLRLISLFADQAAIAVENTRLYARLERQAILDDLTGLYNRRGLMDLGYREVERAIRFLRPLCAIFIDIDHFKDFNDRYSHAVGDQVLITVAKTLKQGVREVDLVGRYGGEEFIILLVETNLSSAQEVANRLRLEVERTVTATAYGNLGVTVSMGVSQFRPDQPTLDTLIHRADRAMYQAKLAGRNCVMTNAGE